MITDEILQALCDLDFYLFPVYPDKVPCLQGWRKDASNDFDTVKAIFEKFKHRKPGIGVECGRSDLTVVDVDCKSWDPIDGFKVYRHATPGSEEDGKHFLARLEQHFSPLPMTLTQITPSTGVQYL